MKDDTERILEGLTPRGARAELRAEVLGAVGEELAATQRRSERGPRWDLRIGAAVAASLVLGALLNVWAIRSDDARQARLFGPERLPSEIIEAVATARQVGGPECAELVRRRFVAAWQARRRDDPAGVFRSRQQLIQLVLTDKGVADVDQASQMDRHRPGRPDRSALDRQRGLRVA